MLLTLHKVLNITLCAALSTLQLFNNFTLFNIFSLFCIAFCIWRGSLPPLRYHLCCFSIIFIWHSITVTGMHCFQLKSCLNFSKDFSKKVGKVESVYKVEGVYKSVSAIFVFIKHLRWVKNVSKVKYPVCSSCSGNFSVKF